MIEDLFAGDLWDTGRTFEHRDTLPEEGGAIVVIPGAAQGERVADINHLIARLPWCIVFITSDEERRLNWRRLAHPNMRVWIQYTDPNESVGHTGTRLPLGYASDTREILQGVVLGASSLKSLKWFFAGQVTQARRAQCIEALRDLGGGQLIITEGFGQGLPRSMYLSNLVSAMVAPCPSGFVHVDSFRVYEALEAGCYPLVDGRTPNRDASAYWARTLGDGFEVVSDWATLPERIDRIVEQWPAPANRAQASWRDVKRGLALRLDAQLTTLGVEGAPQVITALMPTSPVPSNPSTDHIEETIASIRDRLPLAEIVVMCDGVRAEQQERRGPYAEFVNRLLWLAHHRWRNVSVMVHDDHQHQAAMTRLALERVTTPTVLFVEHDTPLTGEIPFDKMTEAIAHGDVDLIRFHHEAQVLDVHQHMMLDRDPQLVEGVPLLRTVQWSQRPHLASTGFYRRIIRECFGVNARTMIEDAMHGIVHTHWREYGLAGWERFRLWMYAPEGDIKRSTHLDTRGDDPKFGMTYAYDGPAPVGAPAAT